MAHTPMPSVFAFELNYNEQGNNKGKLKVGSMNTIRITGGTFLHNSCNFTVRDSDGRKAVPFRKTPDSGASGPSELRGEFIMSSAMVALSRPVDEAPPAAPGPVTSVTVTVTNNPNSMNPAGSASPTTEVFIAT